MTTKEILYKAKKISTGEWVVEFNEGKAPLVTEGLEEFLEKT